MIEKKFIESKKAELAIREFVKKALGKGKISDMKIERTPIGERIIISTTKPGLVIGRGGSVIQEITETLKKQFKFENPKVEIAEVAEPEFDAQSIADQIALALERFGPMTFKTRAYKAIERLKECGALGAEIVLSGKLPSEKARAWRFSFGYLKKTGEIDMVNKGEARAETIPGTVGVKVSIVPKGAKIPDKIEIPDEIKEEIPIQSAKEVPAALEQPQAQAETLEKKKRIRKKKTEAAETAQEGKKPKKQRKAKEKSAEENK